jgi:hypothetical protein
VVVHARRQLSQRLEAVDVLLAGLDPREELEHDDVAVLTCRRVGQRDDPVAVRGRNDGRGANAGFGAQGVHPRELRQDLLAAVVTEPVHPHGLRAFDGILDPVCGILGDVQQLDGRVAVQVVTTEREPRQGRDPLEDVVRGRQVMKRRVVVGAQ